MFPVVPKGFFDDEGLTVPLQELCHRHFRIEADDIGNPVPAEFKLEWWACRRPVPVVLRDTAVLEACGVPKRLADNSNSGVHLLSEGLVFRRLEAFGSQGGCLEAEASSFISSHPEEAPIGALGDRGLQLTPVTVVHHDGEEMPRPIQHFRDAIFSDGYK